MVAQGVALRNLAVGIPVVVALGVCALVAGVLIGLNLPFGSKPLTVTQGTAAFRHHSGSGTFQADRGGVTALIPSDVPWVDASGRSEVGSAPSCLRASGDAAVAHARVEAGYAWLRGPDGSGVLIVGWIRCL
jgi:hypothetical protein